MTYWQRHMRSSLHCRRLRHGSRRLLRGGCHDGSLRHQGNGMPQSPLRLVEQPRPQLCLVQLVRYGDALCGLLCRRIMCRTAQPAVPTMRQKLPALLAAHQRGCAGCCPFRITAVATAFAVLVQLHHAAGRHVRGHRAGCRLGLPRCGGTRERRRGGARLARPPTPYP